MYTTEIFEAAANSCGYIIDRISYENSTVRKVNGRIPVEKKITIHGASKTMLSYKRVRWDALGYCFSRKSNVRQHCYDLPLATILELIKLKSPGL